MRIKTTNEPWVPYYQTVVKETEDGFVDEHGTVYPLQEYTPVME